MLQTAGQGPPGIVPPDTSYEDGVTSVPGADRLTTDVRTLVSVGTLGTGHIITGHRDQEATPAQALPLDNIGIQL